MEETSAQEMSKFMISFWVFCEWVPKLSESVKNLCDFETHSKFTGIDYLLVENQWQLFWITQLGNKHTKPIRMVMNIFGIFFSFTKVEMVFNSENSFISAHFPPIGSCIYLEFRRFSAFHCSIRIFSNDANTKELHERTEMCKNQFFSWDNFDSVANDRRQCGIVASIVNCGRIALFVLDCAFKQKPISIWCAQKKWRQKRNTVNEK